MASLTETAYYTRKAIKYGALGLILLVVFKGLFSAGLNWWRKLHPAPPPPPTVAFGKLPKIKFPESKFKQEKLVFKLETTSGGTPNLGDRARVYFMPSQKSSLLALERAKNQAARMGFFNEPKKISETVYQWQQKKSLLATLTLNIITGNFTLKKNWQEDETLLNERLLPDKKQAIIEARNFFQKNGLDADDLSPEKARITFFRFTPPNLTPAISLSEADFVRIDLFRKDLAELPLLPANPKKALVSILFSGSRVEERRILEVEYTHFPIDTETFATYPLKTSAQAWEELKTGKGFIANLEGSNQQIVIRKIYLAYFESEEPQNYLQPIYVFEGDNDFIAYVPAISNQWTD